MTIDITKSSEADSISLQELALYHAITAYRSGLGLDPIRLSRALSTTANRHVLDTRENIWAEDVDLSDNVDSLHTWSDAPYRTDGSTPEVMWEAPQRVGVEYGSAGYEISAAGYPTTDAALDGWKASSAHNAVLANLDVWADREFLAIGLGADTSPGAGDYAGRIFHVWFGETVDPETPEIAGSPEADTVVGTVFGDVLRGYGGDDDIRADLGDDEVRGGSGRDRISGDAGDDMLYGGGDDDRLYGGSGADRLSASDGDDRLNGGGGADRIFGGDGADEINGGSDSDVLMGDRGADVFVFDSVADSPAGSQRDVIADFERKTDAIDLTRIDAVASSSADDAFQYIGADAFSGRAGELRRVDGLIEGDVNGDRAADFQIELQTYTVVETGDNDARVEVSLTPLAAAGDFLL